MAILVLIGIAFLFINATHLETPSEVQETQMTIADSVKQLLIDLRVQHPHIVYAKLRLESGNFTSFLFNKNNNCAGMRYPRNRVTLAKGERYGYAYYDSWRDCVIDYAMWQINYAKDLTQDQYLNKLSVYAEDSLYKSKIIKLSNYD